MNTGKIFSESEDIYQDQARVLFNYYKSAAEKIVNEEIDFENKIAEVEADKAAYLGRKPMCIGVMIGSIAVGVALAIAVYPVLGALFLIPVIIFLVKLLGSNKAAEECDAKIAEYEAGKAAIRRDYKVNKVSVAYVPIKKNIPFGEGHIAVDLTETADQTKFSLSTVRQPEAWNQTLSTLNENMNSIPVVEGSDETENLDTADYSRSIQNVTMHDYTGSIDRQVRNIRYLLNDSEKKSVALPLVKPGSREERFVKDFATSEIAEGHPVVNVFDETKFDAPVKVFNDINIMKKGIEQGDASQGSHVEYYKKLMRTLGESVQYITASKVEGCNKLVQYCNSIFANVLKASYNQYSPTLEAEEIERIKNVKFDFKEDSQNYKPFYLQASSRVKYDLFQSVWVAEDDSRTNMPFSMSQLQEEVFAPLIENLMEENRKDRLDVYNNIEDQKRDYLNQWHQETQDFSERSRTNALNLSKDMAAAMSDFLAATNTYEAMKKSLDSMKKSGSVSSGEITLTDTEEDTLLKMRAQANMCKAKQDEFQETMSRLHEDIDLRSEEFGYVEYFEGTLRDSEAQDVAQSAENIQDLDPRRKALLSVNSYMAKNANLPPEPSVNENLLEDFNVDLVDHVEGILQKFEEEGVKEDNSEWQAPAEPVQEWQAPAANVQAATVETAPAEETSSEPAEESEEGNFIFCTECGSKNSADSLFCEECGAKLGEDEEA
ncbi:MAG: zinc ribbon domain-containing protein [Fibrobacter sp.]|nr:zinc ribbon domain-containing protein [Fibrobacter sp.]